MKPLSVAVRNLCEFAARRGDLDQRYTPAPTSQEGLLAQRQWLATQKTEIRAEVSIDGVCAGLRVSGRIDAVAAEPWQLFEIKAHRGDWQRLPAAQRSLHWAQLRCYGALWCQAYQLPFVHLRLVYWEVRRQVASEVDATVSAEELWRDLTQLCTGYVRWAEQEARHRRARDQALRSLSWPYADFRPGQRELAEAVYKTLGRGQQLLLQAPTGLGKTLGTLFPALKSLATHDLDRVFFLTVRGTGQALAREALNQVSGGEGHLRALTLVARRNACEYPDRACQGQSCPLAAGFYDRLPAARAAAIEAVDLATPAMVRQIALQHDICPYYFGQELARWADVVIADVNYYFDQHALLYALSQQFEWRVALLVDEAHNLVERARAMYSATLDEAGLHQLRTTLPEDLQPARRKLQREWGKLRKSIVDAEPTHHEVGMTLDELPTALLTATHSFTAQALDWMVDHPVSPELQEVIFEALIFLRLVESEDAESVCQLRWQTNGNAPNRLCLAWRNLIPASHLQGRWRAAHAAVAFSATLTPYRYFRDLLGCSSDSLWLDLPSPFAAGQLEVRLVTRIDTRQLARQRSAPQVAARIVEQYRRLPANYLVYLSSFAYLNLVRETLQQQAPDIPLCHQVAGMAPTLRQAFLDSFQTDGRQIGLAVLGGAFAEGIDLPGDRLKGVFVVTLGLPPHDEWHRVLSERLQLRFQEGYRYTYLYPGLGKVVQAAGRLLRTPTDEGVIELIDPRFARSEVQHLLPAWWPLSIA